MWYTRDSFVVAAGFGELSMKMQNVGGTRSLVQIIYILGDDENRVVLFQGFEGEVSGVGLDFGELASAVHCKILRRVWDLVPRLLG
jgi:hypothetical protein